MKLDKPSRWTYLKNALTHPWHIVVLAGTTVFGVANWSFLILGLVFLAIELVLLGIVYNLKSFRSYVEEGETYKLQQKAALKRAKLLDTLRQEDRSEYIRLETRLLGVQKRLENFSSVSVEVLEEGKSLLQDFLEISMLLAWSGAANPNEEARLANKIRHLINQQSSGDRSPILQQRIDRLLTHQQWCQSRQSATSDMIHHRSYIEESIDMIVDHAVMPVNNKYRVNLTSSSNNSQEILSEMQEFVRVEDIDMEMMLAGRAK